MQSWLAETVLAESKDCPEHDLYGWLFFYLRNLFHSFLTRLRKLNTEVEFTSMSTVVLQAAAEGVDGLSPIMSGLFDRVVV